MLGSTLRPRHRALVVAGVAGLLITLITACAALLLYTAGALALGVDLGAGGSLAANLIERGPGGWALLMVLLGALGAPVLGLAVTILVFVGRANAD